MKIIIGTVGIFIIYFFAFLGMAHSIDKQQKEQERKENEK